ncbi:MAG: rod shape-determining protein RodA [Bacteroidetes bacterium]|nr:rod shape-determining protein RodA [Bacteroidota bacterium]MBU1116291.1 rod shape-determining protein RodA [Bacteroidota bacterium]MBU1797139.1 rod shape-determining protein RodA [Bacteroidota bacterium]
MKISYKLKDKFDFVVFFSVTVLLIIGLVSIYSATYNHPTAKGNLNKQIFFIMISFLELFVVFLLPARTFRIMALPSYLFSLLLLIMVLFFGNTIYGAKSWMSIGSFGFQPSEFGKIGLIFFLSYWLTNTKIDINNLKDLFFTVLIGLVPIFLILLEPDMGTAIVFAGISLVMIFWSGLDLFGLFVVLSPGIILFASLFGTIPFLIALLMVIIALFYFKQNLFISGAVFVINLATGFIFDFLLKILKPHQVSRLLSFVDPASDPLGSGYNAMQAKVAMGSGGLFGKGFLQGNQTQLRFIPEQWTDFIYCVVGEEFGFIGSILILAIFLVLFLRLLNLTSLARDKFSKLTVVGILTLLFIHFSINIGMNLGITPVIGLPLPFISYGGSSLIANMFLIGVVLNIYRNRKHNI